MARAEEQTNIRLPIDLKTWVQKQAAKNNRSMTAEVIVLLEACRKREGAAARRRQ